VIEDGGGPAFPCVGGLEKMWADGMSLRDYFAAQAIQIGWEIEKARPTGPFSEHMEPTYAGAAQRAYYLADAMLKARGEA
jgi:hypothetical protein